MSIVFSHLQFVACPFMNCAELRFCLLKKIDFGAVKDIEFNCGITNCKHEKQ